MTALCGGGSSGPLPTVTGILSFTAGAIETFISSVLGFPELAPLLAPIIAGAVYIDLSTYCATDPPADPGLTALDVANAILVPPDSSTFAAQAKILTWFKARYWWQICHCTSATTPAPPTPSNPGPITSDGGLPTQTAPLCWNVTVPFSVAGGATVSATEYTDLYQTALPAGTLVPVVIASGTPGFTAQSVQIPNTITNATLTAKINEPFVATTGAPNVEVHFFGVSSTLVYPYSTMNVLIGRTSTTTDPPLATLDSHINSLAMYVTNNDTGPHTGTASISWQCPASPPNPTPCCAPDPLLEGELQQILQYVQAIYAGLPIPPSSFAEGAVHSGLTGNGSITFTGVPIALKVTLTTIPPALGFEVGSPNFYFDVGYLSFSTSEGNYAQERLSLIDQVVQVPLLAGSVGYTLLNGVIASITELLPGP